MDRRLKMLDSTAQFIMKFTRYDGGYAENVLYMNNEHTTGLGGDPAPSPFDDGFAQARAVDIAAAWTSNLAPFVDDDTTLTDVTWVWNEALDVGPLHEGDAGGVGLPASGTNVGEPLDSGLTVAVKWGTGLGGRSRRGRTFFVGMNAGLVDAANPNVLKASAVGDLPAAHNDFLADVNGNDIVLGVGNSWFLVVASFIGAGAVRAEALTTKITGASLTDTAIDFQRRRAPNHNRHR